MLITYIQTVLAIFNYLIVNEEKPRNFVQSIYLIRIAHRKHVNFNKNHTEQFIYRLRSNSWQDIML